MYKKMLIISHNCLSKTGSNGRTLLNYLKGWPKEKLAQIYIHSEEPDFEVCDNYFCITDSDVLRSILKRKAAGQCITYSIKEEKNTNDVKVKDKLGKNSIVFLARECAWESKIWNRSKLLNWIEQYKPEVLLFQAGDAAFLFNFVCELSRKYKIPIIMYNTEGYFFKDKSYLPENRISKLVYPILHWKFKKAYNNLMKCVRHVIYNCDMLQQDYGKYFQHPSSVVMCGSSIIHCSEKFKKEKRIVYAGNLGVGRDDAIIEFATAIDGVCEGININIYGKADFETQRKFSKCPNIRYCGFVSYDDLIRIICESEYLLHVENFSEFYREDLKYAFSTKIADSLATGSCLIVYAPEEIAVCKYLDEKECAVLIHRREEVYEKIHNTFNNDYERKIIQKNALEVANNIHNSEINRLEFQNIIKEQSR